MYFWKSIKIAVCKEITPFPSSLLWYIIGDVTQILTDPHLKSYKDIPILWSDIFQASDWSETVFQTHGDPTFNGSQNSWSFIEDMHNVDWVTWITDIIMNVLWCIIICTKSPYNTITLSKGLQPIFNVTIMFSTLLLWSSF